MEKKVFRSGRARYFYLTGLNTCFILSFQTVVFRVLMKYRIAMEQPTRDFESEDVQNRLLDAAEKLFCEKGFERTSVRELTAEAGCNLAAINYYFGGKEKLYTEMFRRQFEKMIQENIGIIERIMSAPEPTVEKLTRAIVTPAIHRVIQNEPNSRVLRMLVREVLNKQIDPEFVARDIKERLFDRLGGAIKQLVPGLPDNKDQLTLVVCSFDGVLLHPFLFIEMYMKMIPGLTAEQLIEHMVKFIVSAIRGYTKSQE
jgi:AcrR family transcriptional regulator